MAALLLSIFLLLTLSHWSAAESAFPDQARDAPHAAQRRPNIIFLQTDSMDGRLLDPTSPYFYKLKAVGFKDWLVRGGASFARHYTNSPQCVPSRTSMLTSRYVHEIGSTNNGQGLARSTLTGKLDSSCVAAWNEQTCAEMAAGQNVTATLIDVVRDAGYALHLFGRFDTGAGILDDYSGTTGDGFHEGPSLPILARGSGLHGVMSPDPLATTDTSDRSPYAPDMHHTDSVLAFLRSSSPPADRPFFMWLGLLDPHPPFVTNATWESHVNESSVDAPPQKPVADMHNFDRFQSKAKNCDNNYTHADVMLMRRAYWGACGEALALMVSVLDAAENNGFLNNTVVIYTSDHGEMSLEHWQVLKNSFYEPSSRVPLIIKPFNVTGLNADSSPFFTNLTSHLDILPTIAELAGATLPPGPVRGQSLVPFLRDPLTPPPPRKDFVAMEYHSNFANTGSFALRQGAYKLITFGHTFAWFNATAYPPMLYNVDADPFELTDVAAQNPSLVAAMTATLEQELGGAGEIEGVRSSNAVGMEASVGGMTGEGTAGGVLAQIDAEQMQDNIALFRRFFFERCTGPSLLHKLVTVFYGSTASEVDAQVLAWFGQRASAATGTVAC